MRRRYLKAPWFTDPDESDLVPQGDPETVVSLPSASIVGLHIRGLWVGPMMLGIKEDAEGVPVSCAITTDVALSIEPAQSNPRRYPD